MVLRPVSRLAARAAVALCLVSAFPFIAHAQTSLPVDRWIEGALTSSDPKWNDGGIRRPYDCFEIDTVVGAEYSVEVRAPRASGYVELGLGAGRQGCRSDDLRSEDTYNDEYAWQRFTGDGRKRIVRATVWSSSETADYRLILRTDASAVRGDDGQHASPGTLKHWHANTMGPIERLYAARVQLAGAGDVEVLGQLGLMRLSGAGTTGDVEAGLETLRTGAEAGSSEASAYLGYLYQSGQNGVTQDFAQAVNWYRRAAQGYDDFARSAKYALGDMYYNGQGVTQNRAEAARLFAEIADSDAGVQRRLAYMYATGDGVAQDRTEYLRRLDRAIEAGDAIAAWIRGNEYAGEFTTAGYARDDLAALVWLMIAERSGLSRMVNAEALASTEAQMQSLRNSLGEAGAARAEAMAVRCIQAQRRGCEIGAPSPTQTLRGDARMQGRLAMNDRMDAQGRAFDCFLISVPAGSDFTISLSTTDFDGMLEVAGSCEGAATRSDDSRETGYNPFNMDTSTMDLNSRGDFYARAVGKTGASLGEYSIEVKTARWQAIASNYYSNSGQRYVAVRDHRTEAAARNALANECSRLGISCRSQEVSRNGCVGYTHNSTHSWTMAEDLSTGMSSMLNIDGLMSMNCQGCPAYKVCPSPR